MSGSIPIAAFAAKPKKRQKVKDICDVDHHLEGIDHWGPRLCTPCERGSMRLRVGEPEQFNALLVVLTREQSVGFGRATIRFP